MIWISLIVPLIGAVILLLFYRDKITWWEVIAPIVACLLFTFLFKLTVETVQTSDSEWWGDLGVRAEYYEAWSTWVEETCTRSVPCGTDSKGNTQYCTETYDCSYCDDTPAKWYLVKSNGKKISISQDKYNELMQRWHSQPSFVELNRSINTHFSCGQDGDMYYVSWNNDPLTSEPVSEEHSYENRIQAAHTAFDYPNVTPDDIKQYGLYDYPKLDGYTQPAVLGLDKVQWISERDKDTLQKRLMFFNGLMGPRKQLKVWVLLFQDKPELSANMQEALWKGGNKNEVVICLGVSSHTNYLQWVKAFSWTPNRRLLVNIREDLMHSNVFSQSKIYSILSNDLQQFERKHFKEFSYITVDPPSWAIIITFVLTIAITFFICRWAVVNQYSADKYKPWKTVTEWRRKW